VSAPGASSTADSSNTARTIWRIAQYGLALAFILFAARSLLRQWHDASVAHLQLQLQPGWLALSSLVVLATYLLLVEIWRRVLARFGGHVSLATAARVWFVSNLGKYVPGKVWQVTAMVEMMNRRGVSLTAAGGAAILVAVCNVVAGFVLVLAIGTPSLRALGARAEPVVITATIVLLVGLLTAPLTVRWATQLFNYVSRRKVVMKVPAAAVWESIGGYVATWALYGSAFELFAIAIVGHAGGSWMAYTATFTISYLVGYLWLPAPGGLGAREWAMSTIFVALKLGTPAEAAAITIASRLWLTVLEILPGVIYLVRRPR
jgi:uncharacterized membrane protein YbhN (UPF0104 family)